MSPSLAAATARIGVPTADLYPRTNLGGSIGSIGTGLGDRRSALQAARDQAAIAPRITRAQQRDEQIDSLAQHDAERTCADTEAALALSDAQIARAQFDVFRALGGGWGG